MAAYYLMAIHISVTRSAGAVVCGSVIYFSNGAGRSVSKFNVGMIVPYISPYVAPSVSYGPRCVKTIHRPAGRVVRRTPCSKVMPRKVSAILSVKAAIHTSQRRSTAGVVVGLSRYVLRYSTSLPQQPIWLS